MVEKKVCKFRVQTLIGAVLALLIVLPATFMADSLGTMARNDFARAIVRNRLLLQHEMLSFKMDLIPAYQLQRIIKEVEDKAGLVPLGQNIPKFSPGQLPEIYDAGTLPQMLHIFQHEHQITPLFLGVSTADAKDFFAWYAPDFPKLGAKKKKLLEANINWHMTDLLGIETVRNDSLAGERFQKMLEFAKGTHKNPADAFYYAFREAFSEMVFSPRFAANTYEICGDRFDSLRLFVQYNRLKDREKFYGGYFVVFASRDCPPDYLLKKALKNKTEGSVRFYSAHQFDKGNALVLGSQLSAEMLGYSRLFQKSYALPEKIFVARDISAEIASLRKTEASLAFVSRLAFLAAMLLFFRLFLFAIPQSRKIRKKMLMIVSVVVLVPYIILGNMAFMILGSLNNLRIEEVQAELDRYFAEFENYYSDQKLQHLVRLYYAKEQLIKNINLSEPELMAIDAHDVVEPDFHANLYIYRNDGFSRKFTSGHRKSVRANRFYNNLSARYLDNIGFLDKNSSKARKDFEMAKLTDGFLSELRQGNLEHRIFSAEGCETRDISKIDDFSRMAYFLIPESKSLAGKIKALAFANIADINTNIYQQHQFHPEIFMRQSLFSQCRMSLGLRRPDGSISRWWPGEVGAANNLKNLLEFAAQTKSSGRLLKTSDNRNTLDGWRFIQGESSVFSGEIVSSPDLKIALLIRVFPLLLILFTIISAILFSDVLNSLFVSPVQGFAAAAAKIKEGSYQIRIETEGLDEFAMLGRSFNLMAAELQQRERLRRFISEDLYRQIQQNKESLATRQLQESMVTVLASDIRNFTSITEKFPAEEVVLLLNEYFTEMEAAITGSGGFIVRFVGDAVIAVFHGESLFKSASAAMVAAVRMRRAVASLNERRKELQLFQIENGIGVASGRAITGIAGSETGRKVFCVVGDVTETAETLESLTKLSRFNKIVICSESAAILAGKVETVQLVRENEKLQAFDVVEVVDG